MQRGARSRVVISGASRCCAARTGRAPSGEGEGDLAKAGERGEGRGTGAETKGRNPEERARSVEGSAAIKGAKAPREMHGGVEAKRGGERRAATEKAAGTARGRAPCRRRGAAGLRRRVCDGRALRRETRRRRVWWETQRPWKSV